MKVFFSAGEPSGDQHGARLIRELRSRDAAFEAVGFGGPAMEEAGCRLIFQLTTLAVMGFLRVLPLIFRFRRLVHEARERLDQDRPDAVVLIDFPGFNWWIAKAAHERGIPVFYFLPPQLWAWAPWRIRRVRKWVDHVICALPFEYEWYRSRGVKATWVGHPFFDAVASTAIDNELVRKLQGEPDSRVIALLPGSRNHEVQKNWPLMLEAAARVSAVVPGIRWVVGNYKDEHRQMCETIRQAQGIQIEPEYYVGRTSEVIEASSCCLMVSGSICLELLARGKPGVVLYRVGRAGHAASRFLQNCRFITLTNLVADHEVAPEFISSGDPEPAISRISEILIQWVSSPEHLESARKSMTLLSGHATATGAIRRTAELLLSEIPVLHRERSADRRAA
jgi:lipid-A-disaccharide synthase